MITQKAVDAF